ncbi:MAG: arabinose ABC transporter substrate-binding protein [Armatimonadota bacterium]
MHRRCLLAAALAAALSTGCANTGSTGTNASSSGDKIKIGFVVKSATEAWFQTEWKFADEAATKLGFTLVKQPAVDAEQVMSVLDNLAAQGAQGVVLCTPDTRLGPAIVAKCKEKNLKLLTVDDRLVDADGKPIAEVPFVGIGARDIGKQVGEGIAAEMKRRGWNPAETGAAVLTVDEIETCRERTDGATEALLAAGFPKSNIHRTPWKKPNDIPAAVDAANVVLTRNPAVRKWLAFSSNDDGVLGFVRASEQRNIAAGDVIGIGVNGTSGKDDLKKTSPTGFHASILLSPKTHGYGTAEAMYRWIKDGKEPAKETFTTGTLIDRSNFKEKITAEGMEP